MSITLTSTVLANSDLNEPQGGSPGSDFHEGDFESFLIVTVETQSPIPSAAMGSGQSVSKEWPLSVSTGPSAPSTEFHRETSGVAETLIAGEQKDIAASLRNKVTTDAGLIMTLDKKSIGRDGKTGVLSETKGVVCFMPEKPIRPLAPNLQLGLDMAALEPVETREPAGTLPVFSKSDDGISIEGLILKSPFADPNLIGNPSSPPQDVLNANGFKSLSLAVDPQPLRPIEIALKGGHDQRIDTAKPSPGLHPAGGFELTPPRIRVSFAEIVDVLRSVNDRSEAAPSTVVSETPGADAPNTDAGGGSGMFGDSGGNALLQTSGTQQIETADALGIARSVQQVEVEILRLASAAGPKNENRSLKISLDSVDLGSIEITLIRHEGGSMSAHIVTDNEASRQALIENLVQLRGSLENAGVQLQELEISCRSFSTGTQQGDRQDREGDQAAATRFHSAVTQESSGISEVNGEGHSRLLNLRA